MRKRRTAPQSKADYVYNVLLDDIRNARIPGGGAPGAPPGAPPRGGGNTPPPAGGRAGGEGPR
ncbi:hypothetical protein ACFW15_33530, partial [Streptomyces sp. NPDC058953]